MLPCYCYALPDREEPGFRKAQKEVLSVLEEDRSKSAIIDLLYKELKRNKNNIAKEFLAFVSKECNPQRKVRFAEVSHATNSRTGELIPFNTFSKRLIVKEETRARDPIPPAEDDSDYSWEL